MDEILRLQGIPLALLFAVAGTSKLRNTASTASILKAFRLVDRRFARPMAVALGVGELTLAACVLVLPPAWAGGLALGALGAMTVVLVRQLQRGIRMDCGCLGGGLPAVVSWWTVLRNAFLSLPAFLLVTAPSLELSRDADVLVPAMTIVSLETCALFVIAAALSMQSVISGRAAELPGGAD